MTLADIIRKVESAGLDPAKVDVFYTEEIHGPGPIGDNDVTVINNDAPRVIIGPNVFL